MKGINKNDCNFFAIRKVYEGTLDGMTWYSVGDVVYFGKDKKKMLESVILKVEYDGSIIVENEMGIFSCSVKEMKSGHMAFGKSSECDHVGVLAVRHRNQFTIDLSNWFSENQRCIIETERGIMLGAVITGIKNDGNILISYDGEGDILHYSEVLNISDFYDKTRYLFLARGSRKKSPKITNQHIKTKMGRCS